MWSSPQVTRKPEKLRSKPRAASPRRVVQRRAAKTGRRSARRSGRPRHHSGPMSSERSGERPEVEPAAGREGERAHAPLRPVVEHDAAHARELAQVADQLSRRARSRGSAPPAPATRRARAARTPRAARRSAPSARASAASGAVSTARRRGSALSWPGSRRQVVEPRVALDEARPGRSCCTSASARSPAP